METLSKHLAGKNFSAEDIRKTGLVRPGKQGRGDYDLFRNRLLFPIHDLQGRMVAFGGRVLDDSLPKYINSPETEIYHKGQVLYGLYQARDAIRHSDTALVVEGYFDVLALHRAGFTNAVATCGTALTPDHARLLKRYADKILLIFDEDAAGRQATFRAMDALLPSGLAVSVVAMPSGEDPDSLLKARGESGFRRCLDIESRRHEPERNDSDGRVQRNYEFLRTCPAILAGRAVVVGEQKYSRQHDQHCHEQVRRQEGRQIEALGDPVTEFDDKPGCRDVHTGKLRYATSLEVVEPGGSFGHLSV